MLAQWSSTGSSETKASTYLNLFFNFKRKMDPHRSAKSNIFIIPSIPYVNGSDLKARTISSSHLGDLQVIGLSAAYFNADDSLYRNLWKSSLKFPALLGILIHCADRERTIYITYNLSTRLYAQETTSSCMFGSFCQPK